MNKLKIQLRGQLRVQLGIKLDDKLYDQLEKHLERIIWDRLGAQPAVLLRNQLMHRVKENINE